MHKTANSLVEISLLITILAISLATFGFALEPSPKQTTTVRPIAHRTTADLPLLFEENRGQTVPEAKYFSRGQGYLFLLTAEEAILTFRGAQTKTTGLGNSRSLQTAVVRLRFPGMNPESSLTAEQESLTKTSYLKGSNPSGWLTGISSHRRVRYREIYHGIDLVFYGNQHRLEYDFVVSPGADPNQIQLSFSGSEKIRITPAGDLVLATRCGELRHQTPRIFQESEGVKREIAGRFRIKEPGLVTFEVEDYDRSLALTIDPVLDYSTYLGGSKDETPGAVTADSEGNLYVIGSTGSMDFPLHGPFQEEFAGGGSPLGDVFVTKIDASGSSIVYSTYIGGGGTDIGRSLAVDSAGQVVATGTTFSTDFPSTQGSFQPFCTGMCPFVFQLSADGTQLQYGTFVGRGDGLAVALDSQGRAIVTGNTSSNDFPVKNAFQADRAGSSEAYLTQLSGDGSELVFSTYLGGSGAENLIGKADVATDTAGNIYLTGRTESDDFPTLNPIQASLQGKDDAFVSKFSSQGALVYSTYLGGSEDDVGLGVCADSEGNAYVTGNTESLDFPTHMAFQPSFGGGFPIGDAFVSKISPAGGAFVYSTYLGGQSGDRGVDISVDGLGQAVVVGTGASNFPVHQAFRDFEGGENYVTKLSADGSSLVYSTPIGNGNDDIAVTTFGTDVYIAGKNAVASAPILNAFQPRSNGFAEVYLAHISDAGSLYFAQFGNGDGAVSDILLTNSSSASSSSATVSFRGDDGSPLAVGVTVTGDEVIPAFREKVSELQVTVPPLGAVKITTDGVGEVVSGSVTVTFDIPLGGVIRFNLTPFGIAGVNQSTLVRGFITPVRKNTVNTGIAIHNPEDKQLGLTMRLRNLAGEEIQGGLTSLALPPGGHLAKFINELFGNADLTGFEGTLTVKVGTLNGLIVATALELGTQPGQFTTLPVTPIP